MFKALIELEFDSIEDITPENVLDYIETLVQNDQLYIKIEQEGA